MAARNPSSPSYPSSPSCCCYAPTAVSAGLSRNGYDKDDAGGYEDDEDAADDTYNEVEEDEDDEDGEDDEDDEVEEDEDGEDEEDEDGRGGTLCLQYKYYDVVCPVVAHMPIHPIMT